MVGSRPSIFGLMADNDRTDSSDWLSAVAKAGRRLPAHNIRIVAFAAFLTVGTHGHQVKIAVGSWKAINVRAAPRIVGQIFFQVWPIPIGCTGRLASKRLQSLFGARISSNVEFELIQSAFVLGNLRFGG